MPILSRRGPVLASCFLLGGLLSVGDAAARVDKPTGIDIRSIAFVGGELVIKGLTPKRRQLVKLLAPSAKARSSLKRTFTIRAKAEPGRCFAQVKLGQKVSDPIPVTGCGPTGPTGPTGPAALARAVSLAGDYSSTTSILTGSTYSGLPAAPDLLGAYKTLVGLSPQQKVVVSASVYFTAATPSTVLAYACMHKIGSGSDSSSIVLSPPNPMAHFVEILDVVSVSAFFEIAEPGDYVVGFCANSPEANRPFPVSGTGFAFVTD